jgi:hypothetical protein
MNDTEPRDHFSRQYEWSRRSDVDRLTKLIPDLCPLAVRQHPTARGFIVGELLDGEVYLAGRFQVVAAFIDGYVRAWQKGGG